ncbi:unnamed protein product [Bursaphelenchus okinawaensis]|uniref:Methylthioribose-1-phosphate isomerase n=1 Tax=Bursaphelenchus okinawaensis TaxID=465554 RepID=A0A811L8Q2_9BILA|nr:unnamed protein product [Bursaphelenchus okinawaensis]CAG9119127.1 unnamed protein product [Bursaphelenchus okinawaensis]
MASTYNGFVFEAVNYDGSVHKWDDMSKAPLTFATLRYDSEKKTLQVLDQLKLPTEHVYIDVNNVTDAFNVIRRMNVRGAPLIATVALLGLAIDLEHNPESKTGPVLDYIKKSCEYLKQSRPTAVNLTNEILALFEFLNSIEGDSDDDIRKKVQDRSFELYQVEREENDKLLRESTICVEHNVPENVKGGKLNVITICNTGALATSSFGTALGVIKALHDRNHLEKAYCLETRPYLQGSRLTAFELSSQKIPHTLISDNMAAYLMKTKPIHAVLVGADQIAANGDTANKIGTYQLAVSAKHHGIPFYVIAPTSSINFRIKSGDEIKVEERPADELKKINGKLIAPEDTPVWNPAFDITPNELISAILTEKGNSLPKDLTLLA